jgi:hypothetical protein
MADERPGGWREMRVFISSTFRDMQAERDHLVRFVFPRLREELLKRRVHFVDVDLRWGVTADQDAFELCMDEIDRCRPRFICMLGGRYGWVPPPKTVEGALMERLLGRDRASVLAELYEREPGDGRWGLKQKPKSEGELEAWSERAAEAVALLREAGVEEAGRSITAAEVLHGALEDKRLEEPAYRYFYFREPPVPDGIPDELIDDYREPPGSFAESELEGLKSRIREAEGNVRPYGSLKELGDHVLRDMLDSAHAELGRTRRDEPGEERDAFADESAYAAEFVETRLEHYVVGSRAPLLQLLHDHAEGSDGNGYLCVVGAPGSGKSALLARFYREYVELHRDDLVIAHFVGANASNVRELLGRVCHELVAASPGSAGEELPADYEGLRDRLPGLLLAAAESKRIVLVIDGVNQLDATHGAQGMTWLPDELPPGVRVILSALPSPVLEALRARREPPSEQTLEPLEEGDVGDIISAFLARYRKELDARQRELLLAKQEVREGSPLYLLTALEELRTLGTYNEITHRIEELPGRVRELFHWILVERLENDEIFRDEDDRPIGASLVRAFCSYLAVGREGMSEVELVELIAPGDPLGNVAALRSLLRPYLMRRGELLDFFHAQLRAAVEGEYLDEEHEWLEAHRAVADYFRRKADPDGAGAWSGYPRGLSELPYHLTEGGGRDMSRWQQVYDVLTDFGFLERKVADVGAVEETDAEGNGTTTYTGVFLLQDDYEHALAKMPGADRGGAGDRRRIIVTGTDLGSGLQIHCPHCHEFLDFEEEWRGREVSCLRCQGPWTVNDFLVERPTS